MLSFLQTLFGLCLLSSIYRADSGATRAKLSQSLAYEELVVYPDTILSASSTVCNQSDKQCARRLINAFKSSPRHEHGALISLTGVRNFCSQGTILERNFTFEFDWFDDPVRLTEEVSAHLEVSDVSTRSALRDAVSELHSLIPPESRGRTCPSAELRRLSSALTHKSTRVPVDAAREFLSSSVQCEYLRYRHRLLTSEIIASPPCQITNVFVYNSRIYLIPGIGSRSSLVRKAAAHYLHSEWVSSSELEATWSRSGVRHIEVRSSVMKPMLYVSYPNTLHALCLFNRL
jgi:hypothetical protein